MALDPDIDLAEQLQTAAASGIKSVKADGVEVTAHPLKDMIEADRYLSNKSSAAKPHRGLRFTKLVPPGAD